MLQVSADGIILPSRSGAAASNGPVVVSSGRQINVQWGSLQYADSSVLTGIKRITVGNSCHPK
jgi:hypothetical protein